MQQRFPGARRVPSLPSFLGANNASENALAESFATAAPDRSRTHRILETAAGKTFTFGKTILRPIILYFLPKCVLCHVFAGVSKQSVRGCVSVCSYLNSAAALLLEEDVLRLHVAVDDLVPVEQVQALQQRVRELAHQLKGGEGAIQ